MTDNELRLLARIKELESICYETYQVVGVLAEDCGRFGDADVDKALDNLSQTKLVHEDLLPFESDQKVTRVKNTPYGHAVAFKDARTAVNRRVIKDEE